MKIIEGLYTKVVSRKKQSWHGRAQVTNGESEHAIESLHTIHAFFLVQMKHYFGIRVGGKTMAFGDQFFSQVRKVVNFSVVRNPHTAVFIAHGHVAIGREIDNGQPPAA